MTNIDIVKEKLYDSNASLVVLYQNGICKEYYNRRIEDIVAILLENKDALKGAIIADKVIGKVAGSVLAVAGIKELYALVKILHLLYFLLICEIFLVMQLLFLIIMLFLLYI